MKFTARGFSSCLIVGVGLLTAPVARADLYSAVAAYEKKDHARAFELFRELAELGHPVAQETLALMYVLGEGVKRDNVAGFAWAEISQESGPREKVQPIIDQLGNSLSPEGRARVDELKGQFGKAALERSLLPALRSPKTPGQFQRSKDDQPGCLAIRPSSSARFLPPDPSPDSASGSVMVEATVLSDGRPRNPRALFAIPPNALEVVARRRAFEFNYENPSVEGARVPCTVNFWIRFTPSAAAKHERQLAEELAKLNQGVADRDPVAQLRAAMLMTGWPNLNPDEKNVAPLFIEAAQAGLPTAQFAVGYITLGGWGVVPNREKANRWLELAANAGHHDAEVVLATELLRMKPDAADVARARELLEKAAAGGNWNAKYFLADLLLGDASGAISADPHRSLELLGEVMETMEDDPSAFEIRAAALSQAGDFDAAVSAQKRALARARKLRWDARPQEQRLARYSKSEAWTQRLLDY